MVLRSWIDNCTPKICSTGHHHAILPQPHTFSTTEAATGDDPQHSCLSSMASSNSFLSCHFIQTLNQISCLSVRDDLLYSGTNKEINVYDRRSMTQIETFHITGDGSVKSIVFAREKIFTAHQDSKIRVWDLTASKRHHLLATLPTVFDRVRRFALPKNYVRIRRHKKRLWIEHADAVTSLAVNNNFLYSVSWDKTLKIWRTKDFRCLESIQAHEDAINAVTVSTNGTVYTASTDCKIRIWRKERRCHVLVATLDKHNSSVNALALTQTGDALFSGSSDCSIFIWMKEDVETSNMKIITILRSHRGAILCLSAVNDILLSGSADRTVRIWGNAATAGNNGGSSAVDVDRWKSCICLAVLEGHERPVKSLAMAVEEQEGSVGGAIIVYSGGLDGDIRVWKIGCLDRRRIY